MVNIKLKIGQTINNKIVGADGMYHARDGTAEKLPQGYVVSGYSVNGIAKWILDYIDTSIDDGDKSNICNDIELALIELGFSKSLKYDQLHKVTNGEIREVL